MMFPVVLLTPPPSFKGSVLIATWYTMTYLSCSIKALPYLYELNNQFNQPYLYERAATLIQNNIQISESKTRQNRKRQRYQQK